MESVKKYGAVGNGRQDDHQAIESALKEEKELFFPKGTYVVSDTVKIPSDRKLVFETGACLKLKAKTPRKRGDFLLTNADHKNGDKNIIIIGAIFDGNNNFKNHQRPKDIFKKDGYSGILINFYNVKNLVLQDITLKDPVSYYTRFCKIDGFLLENIRLTSKRVNHNQDGIHFAGEVRNGTVRKISVLDYGQTNDDLLALNADDYLGRIEEFDTVCGTIENVLFEDISAESCHDAIRLLSYRSEIKNIVFRNLNVGFRCRAVDNNAARGCRAELFKEKDEPYGVGKITNITFENCTFCHTIEYPLFWKGSRGTFPHSFVTWGALSDNVNFVSCRFLPAKPLKRGLIENVINAVKRKSYNRKLFPAFCMKFVTNQEVIFDGKTQKALKKEDVVTVPDFCNLSIKTIK